MMNELRVLALDSGATPCCAAFAMSENEARPCGFAALEEPRDLSRRSINLIDDVLREAKWTLADVQLLAVGTGPGSWTGLRIGLSTFKTLAQARDLPLCAIGTFEALRAAVESDSATDSEIVAVVAPSRPGELYASVARRSEAAPVRLISPSDLARELAAAGETLLAAWDEAALRELEPCLEAAGARAILRPVAARETLGALAQLAAQKFARDQADDPLRVEPLYLAPSNAERVRDAKLRAAGLS